MKQRIAISILIGWAFILNACGDLTFENKGNVDFERFQSVFVLPIQISGIYAFSRANTTDDAYDFLVGELRRDSGFREVVATLGYQTDTSLSVQVSVREDYDYDRDIITYYVQTKFILMDETGAVIYSEQASDNSEDLESAVYETLTQIVNFFIRPYRI